jgi:resuscitation-promoting factor RpfA
MARLSTPRLTALGICAALITGILMVLVPSSTAWADPSADAWHQLRVCESGDNYSINTGNAHYGAYQFDLATWRSVGGSGYPYQASAGEQDARALILYRMRGWQPWQCASILGLHEDADARSGRISDIQVPGGGLPPASHAWPGTYYTLGAHSAGLRQWQLKMKFRGAPLTGTGRFGTNTLATVKRVQRLNHLPVTGVLGPRTWALAWTGRYTAAVAKPKPVTAPRWPGTYYSIGDHSLNIRTWQLRMKARGAALTGSGQFGTNTLAVVKRIQRLNHLRATGILGPVTWPLAWKGKY